MYSDSVSRKKTDKNRIKRLLGRCLGELTAEPNHSCLHTINLYPVTSLFYWQTLHERNESMLKFCCSAGSTNLFLQLILAPDGNKWQVPYLIHPGWFVDHLHRCWICCGFVKRFQNEMAISWILADFLHKRKKFSSVLKTKGPIL